MHLLRVRKQAKVEILDAFARYFQNSPPAAQRFVVAVDEAIARIEEAPEQFPVIHGRLRRALLRRFPYAVYFKIYPSVISVVGVIHGHRHPDTWLLRS